MSILKKAMDIGSTVVSTSIETAGNALAAGMNAGSDVLSSVAESSATALQDVRSRINTDNDLDFDGNDQTQIGVNVTGIRNVLFESSIDNASRNSIEIYLRGIERAAGINPKE